MTDAPGNSFDNDAGHGPGQCRADAVVDVEAECLVSS